MATYKQKKLIPNKTINTRRGCCQFCHRQFKSKNKKLTTKLLILHQERCDKNIILPPAAAAARMVAAQETLEERSAINYKNTIIYDVKMRVIRDPLTKNEMSIEEKFYFGKDEFLKRKK